MAARTSTTRGANATKNAIAHPTNNMGYFPLIF
jgi:hypothetical protein